MSYPLTKSKNTSALTVEVVSSTVSNPLVDIAAIAFVLFPLQSNRWQTGVTPLMAYPHFRIRSRASDPVSSTHTNISAFIRLHWAMKAPRSIQHLWLATCQIFLRVNPYDWSSQHTVQGDTSIPHTCSTTNTSACMSSFLVVL